jgi:organic radical activating enzyme
LRNYYCSQKFWWLSVDLEKRVKNSCCSADTVRIDVSELEQNPDALFNCDQLQQERQQMLNNQRVATCEKHCWIPQDQGKLAKVDLTRSYEKTHVDIVAKPEYLNVVFGSDCNLTCVYCCKTYSSAWRRDIVNQGDYQIFQETSDRLVLNTQDKLLNMASRPEIQNLPAVQTVIESIRYNAKNVKQLVISGGEPFLSNGLVDLLNMVDPDTRISINTGLGVAPSRLQRFIEPLSQIKNLTIEVSAESVDQHYEFVRYGNSWKNFSTNLELLRNLPVRFRSVITNITALNFAEFCQRFSDYDIEIQFCSDPSYLSTEVLDPATKDQLISQLNKYQEIVNNMQVVPSEQQRLACRDYLTQFAQRRNISLDIFPKEFISWLQ